MAECAYCSKEYNTAHGGFTVFERDGTAKHYCSRKCNRNTIMGRDSRKAKWSISPAAATAKSGKARAAAKTKAA